MAKSKGKKKKDPAGNDDGGGGKKGSKGKKGKDKKQLTKQDMELAKKRAEAEELEKQKREAELAAIAEKKAQIELAEREGQLISAAACIQTFDKWVMGRIEKNKMLQEWRTFVACRNVPNFVQLSEVNAYLEYWRSEMEKPNMKTLLKMAPELLQVIEELKQFLKLPADKCNLDMIKALGLLYHDMIVYQQRYMDKCTYNILQDLSDLYDPEVGIFEYLLSVPQITHCLWGNMFQCPDYDGHNFQEVNFQFKIPEALVTIKGVYRLIKTEYDHYSDSCKSYFAPGTDNALKRSIQDWIEVNDVQALHMELASPEDKRSLVQLDKSKSKAGKKKKGKGKGDKKEKKGKKGKGKGDATDDSDYDEETRKLMKELDEEERKQKKAEKKASKKASKKKLKKGGVKERSGSGEETTDAETEDATDTAGETTEGEGGEKKKKKKKKEKEEEVVEQPPEEDPDQPPKETREERRARRKREAEEESEKEFEFVQATTGDKKKKGKKEKDDEGLVYEDSDTDIRKKGSDSESDQEKIKRSIQADVPPDTTAKVGKQDKAGGKGKGESKSKSVVDIGGGARGGRDDGEGAETGEGETTKKKKSGSVRASRAVVMGGDDDDDEGSDSGKKRKKLKKQKATVDAGGSSIYDNRGRLKVGGKSEGKVAKKSKSKSGSKSKSKKKGSKKKKSKGKKKSKKGKKGKKSKGSKKGKGGGSKKGKKKGRGGGEGPTDGDDDSEEEGDEEGEGKKGSKGKGKGGGKGGKAKLGGERGRSPGAKEDGKDKKGKKGGGGKSTSSIKGASSSKSKASVKGGGKKGGAGSKKGGKKGEKKSKEKKEKKEGSKGKGGSKGKKGKGKGKKDKSKSKERPKTEAERAKERERAEKAQYIPALHDNELNLRMHHILGGTYSFQLLDIPPQPVNRGVWTIHMKEYDCSLKEVGFEADFSPPPPLDLDSGSKKTPEEMEKEAKKQEEELQKLVLADVTVPDINAIGYDPANDPEEIARRQAEEREEMIKQYNIEMEKALSGLITVDIIVPKKALWFEPPIPVRWDPVFRYWSQEGFHDVKFDERTLKMSFRTQKFGIFGLGHNRWLNLPYQTWELRPMGKNKVFFALTASMAVLEFIIWEDQVCVSNIDNVTNVEEVRDSVLNKFMRPHALIKALRGHNLDVFPEIDSYAYVDGVLVKHYETEDHLYQCMALTATAFNFQWSRWNLLAGREKLIYQFRERHGTSSPANYQMCLTTPRKSIRIDCTEVSPNYAETPIEEFEYNADLLNLVRTIGTPEALNIISHTNPHHVETLRIILTSVRPLSFS